MKRKVEIPQDIHKKLLENGWVKVILVIDKGIVKAQKQKVF